MKRTLIGVLAVSFFVVPGVGQSVTAGMETLSGQGEAAKPARTFVYDFNSAGGDYEAMVRAGLQGCPVAMEAKRLGGGDLVRTGKSAERGPGQRIRLTLRDRNNSARVVGARVAVRGTNGKPRMSTLAVSANQAGEITRMVTLNFTDHGESWAAVDMLLRGLTSVSRVRLESLTFADGTTWEAEQGSSCSVVPDPLMLVSGR